MTTVFRLTVVVAFAASLAACAGLGPIAPVAVTDIKTVAGTWRGLIYRNSVEADYIEMTIRDDGSYDLVSRRTVGGSRGRGKLMVKDGGLILQGDKGHGVATLTSSSAGDRILNVEATLSDNSLLTAKLSPAKR
jgi:hypothetical protein